MRLKEIVLFKTVLHMKRPLLILQLFVLLSIRMNGESRFQKLYGDTLDDDLVRIIKTGVGDYLLLGTVDISNSGTRKADIALYRTNVTGDLLYSYLIGDTSTNVPTDMVENPDGSYTICGYVNDRQQDMASRDFFLLRMDDAGTILWENTYGIAGVRDEVRAMTRSADGGVFLTGNSDDHALVCKADQFGQIIWSYRIDSLPGANQSYFNCITPTFDGGCVVAGWGMVTNNWPNPVFSQGLVARFSDSGQPLWIRSISDSFHSSWARDITFVQDGGFLVTGTHDDNGTALQSLYKLNSNGNTDWSYAFNGPNGHSEGTAVFSASDDKILIGGSCNQNGPYAASLIMTDSTGVLHHQWLYGTGAACQIVDGLDGGFLVCGRYEGNPFNSDGYLIKSNDTGLTGCSEANASFSASSLNYQSAAAGQALACTLDQGFAVMQVDPYINQFGQLCSWIGIDESVAEEQPLLYPNPSDGTAFFNTPFDRTVSGEIIDLQGRVIATFFFNGTGEHPLPVSSLADGYYLVRSTGCAPMRLVLRR